MEQNQYRYEMKVGSKTYHIIVRQTEGATEDVSNRIKKLLLKDLSEMM